MEKVNDMIGRFYRSALNEPLPRFREAILKDIASVVPFDGALWGTANAKHFHSLTLLDIDSGFAHNLEDTRSINTMYDRLIAIPDSPVDMMDMIPDDSFYHGDLYNEICRPFGIERVLGASFRNPHSGLHNLVALFRSERSRPFSKAELRTQGHLISHMMNAVSLAYTVYLSQVSMVEGGSRVAIFDRYGVCYDMQPSFLRLVQQRYPHWQGGRLPFDLPTVDCVGSNQVSEEVQGLRFSTSPIGDLLCVQAWDPLRDWWTA